MPSKAEVEVFYPGSSITAMFMGFSKRRAVFICDGQPMTGSQLEQRAGRGAQKKWWPGLLVKPDDPTQPALKFAQYFPEYFVNKR